MISIWEGYLVCLSLVILLGSLLGTDIGNLLGYLIGYPNPVAVPVNYTHSLIGIFTGMFMVTPIGLRFVSQANIYW